MIIDVKDLIPTETANLYRYEIVSVDGTGTGEYMYLKYAPGELASEATLLDRDLFMKLQGFVAGTTVFNSDGSITETNSTGSVVTTFLADGSVQQVFTSTEGTSIGVKTTFNPDGSITQTIV